MGKRYVLTQALLPIDYLCCLLLYGAADSFGPEDMLLLSRTMKAPDVMLIWVHFIFQINSTRVQNKSLKLAICTLCFPPPPFHHVEPLTPRWVAPATGGGRANQQRAVDRKKLF